MEKYCAQKKGVEKTTYYTVYIFLQKKTFLKLKNNIFHKVMKGNINKVVIKKKSRTKTPIDMK